MQVSGKTLLLSVHLISNLFWLCGLWLTDVVYSAGMIRSQDTQSSRGEKHIQYNVVYKMMFMK